MSRVDRATRLFWRYTGREVDLETSESWLAGLMNHDSTVADNWLHTAATDLRGTVRDNDPLGGLLPDMAMLDGPGFRAADLRPEVRDFYENTSAWRMEVWTEWNPIFKPAGHLISQYFGRRIQQLTIPTRPMAVAKGLDSNVATIRDEAGRQVGAGWIRTLRTTGEYVYSGSYSVDQLPLSNRPSVHVTFPLELGNIQVFLQPDALKDGSLRLRSTAGVFGQDGAYIVVVEDDKTYAARVPLHEVFRVYVDAEGTLRTDHRLKLWSSKVVHLHYKLFRP